MDGYTVGEVARLARISVRTLHHYDSIGLLTPSARSAGGHRLYSDRQHISRWFYDCDHEMHRGLADIYVSDPGSRPPTTRSSPAFRNMSTTPRTRTPRAASPEPPDAA